MPKQLSKFAISFSLSVPWLKLSELIMITNENVNKHTCHVFLCELINMNLANDWLLLQMTNWLTNCCSCKWLTTSSHLVFCDFAYITTMLNKQVNPKGPSSYMLIILITNLTYCTRLKRCNHLFMLYTLVPKGARTIIKGMY